jgi:hypothetical protein
MAGRGRDQHQPEPWRHEGRAIVNASGWTLAKTIFEADARRIVAAVNDVLGIPTPALEAGFIREILVPRPEETSAVTIDSTRFRPHPWTREFFIRPGSRTAQGREAPGDRQAETPNGGSLDAPTLFARHPRRATGPILIAQPVKPGSPCFAGMTAS